MIAMGDKTSLIGIGQYKISSDANEILVAPNLGSCLGVSVYDPKHRRGGLIHCLLPFSKNNPDKALKEPHTFVDTGVVSLISQMLGMGSDKRDLILAVGGGSNINDANNIFEIGAKNYTVLKKVLWKNNLLLKGEHIGSNVSRTVSLSIATGEVWVKVNGEQIRIV